MKNANKIKNALEYCEISEAELARRINTSPQAFNQRLKNDKFSSEELERIADALGAKFEPCAFIFPDGTKI